MGTKGNAATLKKNRLQIMGKVGPRAQQKANKEEKKLAKLVSRDAKKVVRKQKRLDQATQAEQLAKIVEKRSKSVLKKTGEAAIKAATKLAEDKAKQKKKERESKGAVLYSQKLEFAVEAEDAKAKVQADGKKNNAIQSKNEDARAAVQAKTNKRLRATARMSKAD